MSIYGLESLIRLVYLRLNNCQVQSIASLQLLVHLQALHVCLFRCFLHFFSKFPLFLQLDNNPLRSIVGIDFATELTTLQANECQLTERMTDLTELYLRGCQLTSVLPLQSLFRMTILDLADNPLGAVDALQSLNNLTSLNLTNCQVSSVWALRTLVGLTKLELAHNLLQNVDGIGRMIDLIELRLNDCHLTTIASLHNLRQIAHLDVRQRSKKMELKNSFFCSCKIIPV